MNNLMFGIGIQQILSEYWVDGQMSRWIDGCMGGFG